MVTKTFKLFNGFISNTRCIQIDNGITIIHIVLFHDKYSPNSKLTFVPPNPKEFFNINFFDVDLQ